MHLQLLRRYQLDIIFLYFALALLLWSSFYVLQYLGADPHQYEWHIGLPAVALYFAFLWRRRERIEASEHRALTGTTLLYWIALGILLFFTYAAPLPAADYWSLEALFILFTLFLADSYWDFRKLTIKNVFARSGDRGRKKFR